MFLHPFPIRKQAYGLVLLSLLFAFFQINQVMAQVPQASYGQAVAEAQGKVSGRVIDDATGQAVEFATISLLSATDSALVTGGITNPEGIFSIAKVPFGMYIIKATFIGYKNTFKASINVSQQAPEAKVGVIRLLSGNKRLKEVTVTAEKPAFEIGIDKKIYNVEKTIVNQGGNATDVLQNVPTVTVDTDGNINMRGSGNLTVLIDGRPSGITAANQAAVLRQIPASAIESIELVTNPSARYDAEGMAGIINIVLKKNKMQGINGSASVTAGTNNKYTAAANLNYRTQKFNVYSSYNYRYNERWAYMLGKRTISNAENFFINQDRQMNTVAEGHFIKAGADYYINKQNTIGGSINLNPNQDFDIDSVDNDYLNQGNTLYKKTYRSSDEKEYNTNIDYSLNYKKTFTKPKHELVIDFSGASYKQDVNGLYNQRKINTSDGSAIGPDSLQRVLTPGLNQTNILQADYVHPINENAKFETGYKGTFRTIDNQFSSEHQLVGATPWIADTALNNHFEYTEQINAAYGIYSNKWKDFGYQVGLRAEQTVRKSTLKTTNQAYPWDSLNLFPSAHISYKLAKDQEIQLSASRRITRPTVIELNPFMDYSDPLNLRSGNPNLRPELTNLYELSYMRNWNGGNSFNATAYYRHTQDAIQRYVQVGSNGAGILSFYNSGTRDNYGLELIGRNEFSKWWNVTSNLNFFRSVLNGGSNLSQLNARNFNWSARIVSNTNLPQGFKLQLMGNYTSPFVFLQGRSQPIYFLDLGLSKDVLKKKGTVNLSVTDVFDTFKFGITAKGENFESKFTRKRESRIATIGFTYRFGSMDNLSKGKEKSDMNRSGGGGGDIF